MNDNLVCAYYLLINQKVTYCRAVVSLQLDNITILLVLHHGTVATQILTKRLRDLLQVKIISQSLNGQYTFSAVTHLNTDVYFPFWSGTGGTLVKHI